MRTSSRGGREVEIARRGLLIPSNLISGSLRRFALAFEHLAGVERRIPGTGCTLR